MQKLANDNYNPDWPHIDMDYFQRLDPKVASQWTVLFVSKC